MQTVPVQNLGGGINDYESPDKIGANEMTNASRNVRGDASSCRPRLGYAKVFDEISGSVDGVAHLGIYTRNSASNDKLIMVYGLGIYRATPGDAAWESVSVGTITSSANVNTIAYRDWLFLFNGVDKPFRIDNTTLTQPFVAPASLTTNTFLPSFGEIYGSSLFCAGVPTSPNVVYISKASSSATPQNVYDFSGTLTSFGDANELLFKSRVTSIRALDTSAVIFTIDGVFYVAGLKEFGSVVTFDVQPIAGGGGAVSHQTTCIVENDVFYLTPQKEIKSVRRSQANANSYTTTSLSTKIQRFLDDEISDDLSTAFSYYDQANAKYYLHLKTKDALMNDVRLVADLENLSNGIPAWYIDDSYPMRSGVVYKGKTYIGSSVLGQVYQDQYGLADDDDASIITVRVGKDMSANNPTSYKNFRRVKIFGNITQATTLIVKVYVDGFLVAENTINTDDLNTGSTVSGIGTAPVGDYMTGVESEGDPSQTNLYEFTKDITFRQRGKKLRVDFLTEGVNNDYRIDYMEYSFLPVAPLLSPIIEK